MITTFQQHILQQQREVPYASGDFSWLLSGITLAAKMIEAKIRCAGLCNIVGTAGQTTAAAVWLVAPCTELFNDNRADDSVDLSLGTEFGTLAHDDNIDAVLASLRPGATEPWDPALLQKIHASSC